VFVETCLKCNIDFERDFRTRNQEDPKNHLTGRFCEICNSELHDNLVHFGEKLPKHPFDQSVKHALDA